MFIFAVGRGKCGVQLSENGFAQDTTLVIVHRLCPQPESLAQIGDRPGLVVV